MSSRWLIRDFVKCGRCGHIQRLVQGYMPLPDPVLFDTNKHCTAYHEGVNKARGGPSDVVVAVPCDGCQGCHSSWEKMDFQRYLSEMEARDKASRRPTAAAASRP